MVNYELTAPGVHIEEFAPAGPIVGSGTSTPALIGVAAQVAKEVLKAPTLVTSWGAYTRTFGGYRAKPADPSLNLPLSVRGFFENGGTRAYVVAVADLKAESLTAALSALEGVLDVNLVAVPGLVDAGLQANVITHCELMTNRVAILDGNPDTSPTELDEDGSLKLRQKVTSSGGFAALYWPWIKVIDPEAVSDTPTLVAVPPSGHIAGVIGRSDDRRGVHKAPANEFIRGALDVGYNLTNAEQGGLNHNNVNAIRTFPGQPPVVWGARTLSPDTAWRYLNVRRLFAFVEESIIAGTRWAVFEPNDIRLWKGLERTITEFLNRVWRSGALFGATAKEAFYVKIDAELNPPDVQAAGQLNIEIGMSPVRPAEFVVVRIGIWDGGSQVSEG